MSTSSVATRLQQQLDPKATKSSGLQAFRFNLVVALFGAQTFTRDWFSLRVYIGFSHFSHVLEPVRHECQITRQQAKSVQNPVAHPRSCTSTTSQFHNLNTCNAEASRPKGNTVSARVRPGTAQAKPPNDQSVTSKSRAQSPCPQCCKLKSIGLLVDRRRS